MPPSLGLPVFRGSPAEASAAPVIATALSVGVRRTVASGEAEAHARVQVPTNRRRTEGEAELSESSSVIFSGSCSCLRAGPAVLERSCEQQRRSSSEPEPSPGASDRNGGHPAVRSAEAQRDAPGATHLSVQRLRPLRRPPVFAETGGSWACRGCFVLHPEAKIRSRNQDI